MKPGLYPKYLVTKLRHHEGPDFPEALIDVFVLRPEKDPAAFKALACYAAETPNKQLASDLWEWLERIGGGK